MDVFSKTTNVFVPMVAITPRRLIIATHQVQQVPQALRPPQARPPRPLHLSPAACVCRTVDVPMMNRTVVGLRRITDVLGPMVIVTVKMAALLQRLATGQSTWTLLGFYFFFLTTVIFKDKLKHLDFLFCYEPAN